MCEWWLMGLHHNRNRFRPFAAKSNDPYSINSQKSHFWDSFGHIGHLLGQISTCENGGRWYSTIIGTVLDHFQPNQMTQIGLGVQKVCFSKNVIAFSCLEWLKKFSKLFFFSKISKFPKVGTVLGPFGPKKGQRDFFLKNLIRPLFTPYIPLASCQK